MKTLFTFSFLKKSSTENGSGMDREWNDEVAEKSVRMSTVWAMMRVKLVNLVMQFLKATKRQSDTTIFAESLKCLKSLMQIFVESAESAKSAKPIFATFATYASANFVGKASNESTEMYRVKSRIPSTCLRLASVFTSTRFRLASLICLCMLTLGVGNAWGAVGDAITAHGNIADATVYYLSGRATVSSKTSTYYSVLASDAASESVTGNATTTQASGTKYTFLIESGTYYLVTPNGYYVEPHGSTNGKLILTAAKKAVTVSTVSSLIRITGTTNTDKSIQKNKSTAANFGSYGNSQNDLTLYVAGYRVIYDANGATGGTVPTDATVYADNASATIKANTGSLVKTGYTFAGWNTAANGSGTDVAASGSATRTMTAGLRLYAKWTVAASCSADVAIGDASLNGTFSLSSVGVQCASITPGSNCAVAANNYGFIWYEGTGDKIIDGDGVTRVNNSTAYSSSSFSNTLSSTFTAGTTYTFRAFAINDKPSTAYSAAVSFTPYTVTFNMNGHGSDIAQQVVNTGGTASTPSAPSATGYTFGGWYQEAGCTNSWNFSTTITSGNTTDGN